MLQEVPELVVTNENQLPKLSKLSINLFKHTK